MGYQYQDYLNNAAIINERTGGFKPEVLMILGSGLGFIGDLLEDPVAINYADNSRLLGNQVIGHKNRLLFGKLSGKDVMIMQGRLHYYQGYSMEDVVFPVRMARLLGAGKMIVTNAAGCLHREWEVGDIMLITDHIKLTSLSPLRGENVDEFGPRFNDMSHTYTKRLQELAQAKAEEYGITLRKGNYMLFAGPQYETPAEIRAAAVLGADAVGMSTVPEVIAARQCGMEILGFSMMTNYAAGISDKELDGADVTEAAEAGAERFSKLILGCLQEL